MTSDHVATTPLAVNPDPIRVVQHRMGAATAQSIVTSAQIAEVEAAARHRAGVDHDRTTCPHCWPGEAAPTA